jgi:hypothetical protein
MNHWDIFDYIDIYKKNFLVIKTKMLSNIII